MTTPVRSTAASVPPGDSSMGTDGTIRRPGSAAAPAEVGR